MKHDKDTTVVELMCQQNMNIIIFFLPITFVILTAQDLTSTYIEPIQRKIHMSDQGRYIRDDTLSKSQQNILSKYIIKQGHVLTDILTLCFSTYLSKNDLLTHTMQLSIFAVTVTIEGVPVNAEI